MEDTATHWTLRYDTKAALLAHLGEQPGTLLLRTAAEPAALALLQLRFVWPQGAREATAEVLQLLPGLGVVVALVGSAELIAELSASTEAEADEADEADANDADAAQPPGEAEQLGANAADPQSGTTGLPKGSSALSWPIERLQAEWSSLPQSEKIRVAKHGKRPARALILRSQDKVLHAFLLKNNGISTEEVAMMASMANLDPNLLRQLANAPEWAGTTSIARNLVANPKLPLPLVRKLMTHLPMDEMRRLAKSGNVRQAIKRMLIQQIERGR